MRWSYILALIGGSYLAFMMAMVAGYQLAGIQGNMSATLFILGPSWGWFAFDVGGFIFAIAMIVLATYGLSK